MTAQKKVFLKILSLWLTFTGFAVAQDTENTSPQPRESILIMASSYFNVVRSIAIRTEQATKIGDFAQFVAEMREINRDFREVNDAYVPLLEPAARSCFQDFSKEEQEQYYGDSLRKMRAAFKKTDRGTKAMDKKFGNHQSGAAAYQETRNDNIEELRRLRTITDPLKESCL